MTTKPDNDEELAEFLHKLEIANNEIQDSGVVTDFLRDSQQIPKENLLDKVEYQEPSRGVDPEKLLQMMKQLHSVPTCQLRTFLKDVHLPAQGTKKQLRERFRRFYRKEYAVYRMRTENEHMGQMRNKTLRHFDYLVAVDFECTCEMIMFDYPHEIIEFPAVLIDVRKMEIISRFRTYIRPTLNPILDDFCIQLCGIKQDVVDAAPLFLEGFQLFEDWLTKHSLGKDSSKRYAFVTDGPHDFWKFFQFQCSLSGIKVAHEYRAFINIKKIFEHRVKKLAKENGKSGIQNMLAHYEMEFEGQKHSGLDDATNIARLCIKMMEEKIELRINQRMTMKVDKNEDRKLEEFSKADSQRSDHYLWQKKLPLKLRQVSREEFLSGEYQDCESCDEL